MIRSIKDILEEIYKDFKTMDPFHVIEMKGIELEYVPFSKDNKTLGLYMKSLDEPTIYIKDELEHLPKRYFVAAHELHHALEHESLSGYYLLNSRSRAKMEQEANKFAVAMCMNLYMEEHASEKQSMTSVDLKRYYGVPLSLSEILL